MNLNTLPVQIQILLSLLRFIHIFTFSSKTIYFILKSIMVEIRILSDCLTLISWFDTVFIFNVIDGVKYFTIFSGIRFSIWVWKSEEIKAQRGQLTFLRAHSKFHLFTLNRFSNPKLYGFLGNNIRYLVNIIHLYYRQKHIFLHTN